MNKHFKYLLPYILTFPLLSAQNYTVKDLVKKWSVSSIQQTIEAEDTYTDLKNNFDQAKFEKNIADLEDYLIKHYDERLYIRKIIYEKLGNPLYEKFTSLDSRNEIHQLFKKALLLKDEQLLSEIYSLYAERNQESIIDRLFYLNKAIEIQEEIGVQYFPRIYLRYFVAGHSYYLLDLPKESVKQNLKSLKNLGDPRNSLIIYVLNLDLLGTVHYKMNQIDSSIYYYQKIQNILEDYQVNYQHYKDDYQKYDADFQAIWEGISDGGIARGLVYQKKYKEALPYLENNLALSSRYNLKNDLAKVYNIFADLYEGENNYPLAIRARNDAYKNALESKTQTELIESSYGLENIYRRLDKYDSAYFYQQKTHEYELAHIKSISQSKIQSVNNRLQHEKLTQLISEADHTIARQRDIRNFILLGSISLLIILVFIYYNHQFKQRLKILALERNQEIAELKLLQSEIEIKEANNQLNLFKHKLQQTNAIIEQLKLENHEDESKIQELQTSTILTKEDWEEFKKQFNKVYPNYIFALRGAYPQISEAELRYLCLVKLNLSQKEIASALGISESTTRVTWFRMRKKLEVDKELNPIEFLKNFESASTLPT